VKPSYTDIKGQRVSSKCKWMTMDLYVVCMKSTDLSLFSPLIQFHFMSRLYQINIIHVRLRYSSVRISLSPGHKLMQDYVALEPIFIVLALMKLGTPNSLIFQA
jgi:hypothetical protein